MAEHLIFPDEPEQQPTTGTSGLRTQIPGKATTVSAAALATGNIGTGHFIERDRERKVYKIQQKD